MEEEKCKCGENCTCGENCNCNEEEKCNENCTCHETKVKKEKKDKKYEALKKQIAELEEESLRSKADLINYRKRKDEEVMRMLKYANEDLVKELLPTIDNLERALKLESENANEEVNKFLSGVKLIYCSTIATLEKYGVKAIDGANKAFDPTYHQAVMTEHVDSLEPGMVIEVLQKGYLLKDKVIRPAMVKVSE